MKDGLPTRKLSLFCNMIYLFNPENDLALSSFSPTYTPPASAVKMAEDLSLFPLWYAVDDSFIWAKDNEMNKRFLENFNHLFDKNFQIFNPKIHKPQLLQPWGWNPSLLKRCRDASFFEEKYLPNISDIKQLRHYSHRKNAVEILNRLKSNNYEFCGESHYFTDISDLLDWLNQRKNTSVLKMPLSGSGKGLVWIIDKIMPKQIDWAKRVIQQQGGVVAEPKFQKLQDFAMEFQLLEGKVEFLCYSLFDTHDAGAYKGNYMLSDEAIENHLAQFGIVQSQLEVLKNKLSEILSLTFPQYKGVLGVDMMICSTPEGNKIHPCVEVNLRMNMGIVAHKIWKNYLSSSSSGKLCIQYFKDSACLLKFIENNTKLHPLVIKDNRIFEVFMPLIPINNEINFLVYIQIKC